MSRIRCCCSLSLRERAGVREAASTELRRVGSKLRSFSAGFGPLGLPHPGPLPEGEGAAWPLP